MSIPSHPHRNPKEGGFTLLEIMFAVVLFTIVVTGLLPVMTSHVQRNRDARLQNGAVQAATVVLDRLRLLDPATELPTSGSDDAETVTIDGRNYSVVVSYCLDSTYCSTVFSKHLTAEVSLDGESLYSVETVYSRLR